MRLLCTVGAACHEYQDRLLTNLRATNVQCDEIWSFCYAKSKNVPKHLKDKRGYGTVWTWVALDAGTKLVPCWYVGSRGIASAMEFLADLDLRLKNKVYLTTDGHQVYLEAVLSTFGKRAHYGQLIKQYDARERYIGAEKAKLIGRPKKQYISTSYIERQNLTIRMGMRRFTRKTNAHSKKIQNLEYALALHFMHYNFCRPHEALNKERSLGITPAMAAGVADHQWSLEEVLTLLD